MNALTRMLLAWCETLAYGTSYAMIQWLIRSPTPLDPEATWKLLATDHGPTINFIRKAYPPKFARRWLIRAKMKQDHFLGIEAHYDVSNAFYELFLDKKFMFYSCADFHSDSDTIEDAQTHKANFICRLLDPQPGEKILELGCGWGSMLRRVYETTHDKQNLHGYTLSREQLAYNNEHNGFQVELKDFITTDYPHEAFDKIYSIGAWEHVRPPEVAGLLRKLYGALRPGGRLVQHFFCPLGNVLPAAAVVGQIYFPGSLIAPFAQQMQAAEAAGFRIRHRSLHDYRPTLRAWFDRLVANRQQAIELVGIHTYNRYITFFPASWRYFDDVESVLVRMVLEKPATATQR